MPVATHRRLAGAAGIPVLALGLAACGSGPGAESEEAGVVRLSPEQIVLASYEGLEGESFKMETTMTINGVELVEATQVVDGEASRISQDVYMGAILEAVGEDLPEDQGIPEGMESIFTDVHSETILVDGVLYLQLSGGMFDMSEEFGEDTWFTVDLTEHVDLDEIFEQFGGLDLASQTGTLLNEITDVSETGDGVYTGTLSGDSEVMQSMLGSATGVAGDPAAQTIMEETEVVITVDDDGMLETIEVGFPDIEGMTMHMVSEVVEIGGDYGITAPESDNLRSFEEFIGAMQ